MARGFLRGALWGGGVSLGLVLVLSIASDPPQPPDVKAAAPATETAPQPAVSGATKPRSDRVPVTGQEAPKAPAPQPDTLAAVGSETVRPAAQPQTGEASGLAEPGAGAESGAVAARSTETPETPRPQALGLTAPAVDTGVAVSTDPASPPQQPPVEEQLALTEDPQQPAAPLPEPDVGSAGLSEPAAPSAVTPEGSISQDPEQPPLPEVPSDARAFPPEPAPEPVAAPTTQAEPAASAPAVTPAPAEDAESPRLGSAADAPPGTARRPAPQDRQTGPQSLPGETAEVPELATEDVLAGVRAPVGTVGNLAPDVQINRLPNLRDETPAALQPQAGPDETAQGAPARLDRPFDRFAVAAENPDGKPIMAIVLMDEGVDLSAGTIGLPALRSFPYPISFAVDTALPDAAERMAAYRAEGFEVLAMIDLPAGARAQDAETTLSAALDAVPEAVGVLEGVGEGLQGSRDAALQVADILAATGHGFVTQNNGLNTVQKLAARAGVPSAVVFRDFDNADRSPTVIRRFLDQAAFRAGRVGTVVMLGRLREETISALLIWGLQDRAKQVALVPISAALTTQP